MQERSRKPSRLERERVRQREDRWKDTTGSRAPQYWRGSAGCSLLGTGLVLVIVLLVMTGQLQHAARWLRAEMSGGAAAKSEIRLVNNARQLLMALNNHASEHSGLYPDALGQLAPDTLAEEELRPLLVQGSEGSATGSAWVYYPGLTTSAPGGRIVLTSATPAMGGGWIVGYRDGSVEVLPEGKFRRLEKPDSKELPP